MIICNFILITRIILFLLFEVLVKFSSNTNNKPIWWMPIHLNFCFTPRRWVRQWYACVSRSITESGTFLNSHGNPPPAYLSLLNHYMCPLYEVARLRTLCAVTWTLFLPFSQAQSIQAAQDQRQTWDWPHDPYHGKWPHTALFLSFSVVCLHVPSPTMTYIYIYIRVI